mmetsp:Transcript_13261/g.17353  ORF Transcript_13261/g.17353 Transcript_13261/m.17353 type:complete len:312 (-) Transcript_13261:55-990(-)
MSSVLTPSFTQIDPDSILHDPDDGPLSQAKVTQSQYYRLNSMNEVEREALIRATARAIIFQGSGKTPLDKKKVMEVSTKQFADAAANSGGGKLPQVSNAVFDAASKRVHDIYGYTVVPAPTDVMMLANKYQDRYYLVNYIKDNSGTHSRVLLDDAERGARGFLMVILGLIFCKGTVRGGTKGKYSTRWLSGNMLYKYLNAIDDRVPEEPPLNLKGSTNRRSTQIESLSDDAVTIIDKLVSQDYLLREKAENQDESDGIQYLYSMGPRSILEIGRKQLIYFMAEVMDEGEPSEAMLHEFEGDGEEDEELEVE